MTGKIQGTALKMCIEASSVQKECEFYETGWSPVTKRISTNWAFFGHRNTHTYLLKEQSPNHLHYSQSRDAFTMMITSDLV